MRDIGEVIYGYPEKRRYERLNGRDAAQVEVYKSSTANIVDVGLAITEELRKIELNTQVCSTSKSCETGRRTYWMRRIGSLILRC